MSIPVKPWEVAGSSGTIPPVSSLSYGNHTERLHSSAVPYPGSGGGSIASVSAAPALPPRPGQTRPLYSAGSMYGRSMMPYSNYSSPYYGSGHSSYSPFGMSSYGGMGGYGSYGGLYGNRLGMYGGYGTNPMNPHDGQPTFSQLAEESSAGAFQSIESFVSAFGSISAMLESTFHAVYSSFRAVVGVADHMGRLKHILSAMAVFRFFRWVFRRFLYLVGISKIKPEDVESLWSTLSGTVADSEKCEWENELHPNAKGSSWPILMFLGFILAGPYLMWKLISSLNLNANAKGSRTWATGQADHFVAVAEYDFEGMADRELKLRAGQKIRLAPASSQPPNVKGWVLASDGVKIGLVPTNYIKILGKRSGGLDNNDLHMPASATHQPGSQTASTKSVTMEEALAPPNPNIIVTPPENKISPDAIVEVTTTTQTTA